jgi:hypothetical protein
LDGQLVIRKVLQDVAKLRGIGLERVDRIGAQGVLVVVEVGVLNPGQKLFDARSGTLVALVLARLAQ